MKIETARLIGLTEMELVDGHLQGKANTGVSIFDLKPATGMEWGFIFFLKDTEETRVCHIGITHQRERFEVSYGVDNLDLRGKGYMVEALAGFIDFIESETQEADVWGLPNGPVSRHVLEKCGFEYFGPVENSSSSWFLYHIDR